MEKWTKKIFCIIYKTKTAWEDPLRPHKSSGKTTHLRKKVTQLRATTKDSGQGNWRTQRQMNNADKNIYRFTDNWNLPIGLRCDATADQIYHQEAPLATPGELPQYKSVSLLSSPVQQYGILVTSCSRETASTLYSAKQCKRGGRLSNCKQIKMIKEPVSLFANSSPHFYFVNITG